MASEIRYEANEPYYDDRVTYLAPDLRAAALGETAIVDPPGTRWVYNNYHPLLIGMILERVTGKSVTEYLQEKLWDSIGMEYPGSWSINREHRKINPRTSMKTIPFSSRKATTTSRRRRKAESAPPANREETGKHANKLGMLNEQLLIQLPDLRLLAGQHAGMRIFSSGNQSARAASIPVC